MTATATEAPSVAPATPYRWRWLVLAIVLAAEIMDLLDSTVVNIAAPTIRKDLGGTYAAIQWIAAGYTLAFAVMLVTGGRLRGIVGRPRGVLIRAARVTIHPGLFALAPGPRSPIRS